MFERACKGCDKIETLVRTPRSKLCRNCAAKKRGDEIRDVSKTTCPSCGGAKSYQGRVCRSCVDMSGENNPMYGKPANQALLDRNSMISENPELHHNWKGGVNKGRSGKQIAWAKEVKAAFNNICDCCGYSRGVALEAHHYEFSEATQNNFDTDSGVALCSNCHKEFHKTFGYGSNIKEQYVKFKEEHNA